MTSNIISNFWRENSKRNFFDDFDTLCSSPDFVSFGHLAQIVCTSLAEKEWYKKSFAWQSQGQDFQSPQQAEEKGSQRNRHQ